MVLCGTLGEARSLLPIPHQLLQQHPAWQWLQPDLEAAQWGQVPSLSRPPPPSTGQVLPLSFIGKLLPLTSSATLGEVTALNRKAGAREPLATRQLPTERSASFQKQLLNCGLNKLRRPPASCSLGPGGLERKPCCFVRFGAAQSRHTV